MDFIRDFLYTYRYFTTSDKFLELLQRRYSPYRFFRIYLIPILGIYTWRHSFVVLRSELYSTIGGHQSNSGTSLSSLRLERITSTYLQYRVINVLKQWIEDHFNDFDDPALLDKLRSFIFATISMENPKWATCLEEIIHARLICNIVCPNLFLISYSPLLSHPSLLTYHSCRTREIKLSSLLA